MLYLFKFFKKKKCDCDNQILHKLKEMEKKIMATKADVLQAIADEKAQVTQAITDLNTVIQDLKDQIAAGNPVTEADLDEIANAVHDIFVPPPTV